MIVFVALSHGLGLLAWTLSEKGFAKISNRPRVAGIFVTLPPLDLSIAQPRRSGKSIASVEPSQKVLASQRNGTKNFLEPSIAVTDINADTKSSSWSTSPASAVSAPNSPLNLTLSSTSIRSLSRLSYAEQATFRGRLPDTVERQVANAFAESGDWIEERLDYNHIRYRRGNSCIDTARPELARMDPTDPVYASLPWLSSNPYHCR